MSEIRATLNIELDGVSLPDFPKVRRFVVNEVAQTAQSFVPDNNSSTFHQVAAIVSPNVNVIYLDSDQALNLDINQLSALALQAGGFILLFGVSLQQATPANDITINNPALTGGVTANASILATGT